jgi:hypothetical protein
MVHRLFLLLLTLLGPFDDLPTEIERSHVISIICHTLFGRKISEQTYLAHKDALAHGHVDYVAYFKSVVLIVEAKGSVKNLDVKVFNTISA